MSSIPEKRRALIALIALSWSLVACAGTASTIPQPYQRAEWGVEQGLSSGRIQALAQTPDGYLWIGTAEGLLRFDGVRFVPVLTAQKQPLRQILGLTVDTDGALWVRAADTRMRRVQRDSISSPVSLNNQYLGIVTMTAAQTSGLYATDNRKTALRLIHDRVEPLPIHLHTQLISIAETSDRRLWIGTDRGLMFWADNVSTDVIAPDVDQKINCLLPEENGRMWVGTDDGLAYWDGAHLLRRPFSNPEMRHLQILTIMSDHAGNLWLGTSKGLLRYDSSAASWADIESHATETPVTALIQDREGDIWFGNGATLERLESTPIVPVRQTEPKSGTSFGPLYIDSHDRIWFVDGPHGISWMEHGVIHPVHNDGLANDEAYSIDGDGNDVWVGRRSGGLTRLRLEAGVLQSKTWTTRDGLSQNSVYAVRVQPGGTVWAGTLTGGLNRLENGHITHFDERDGLPANDVSSIEFGHHGEVWIGTSGGLCTMEGHRCVQSPRGQQQPLKNLLSLFDDPSHGLWIGTASGLLLADEHGEHPVPIGKGSQPRILGLGVDHAGKLWIATDHAVMSASPADLLASRELAIRTYRGDDGLHSSEGVRRSRSVVLDTSGRVWITTAHELAMIASSPVPLPTTIPHVEDVFADGVLLDRNNPRAAPGTRRLSFSYTGLDLHAPSRVRFRYRLDHFDTTWSDAVSDREATYTNLAPGSYRFRLIASNESNSWTSEESSIQVVIEPYLWQRWPVRIMLAVTVLLLAGVAFHLRMKFMLAQVNLLADERLRERTRIARDLHDTLLQGFISSLMHLHVAERQIPAGSPMKQRFTSVLEGMERVIEEARLAVVGLRTPDSRQGGLESDLQNFFQEIADIGNAHLTLRSTGRPRSLKPEATEHIQFIAREATLNAVRHADAKNVQVTIRWGWLHLKISVSDDGRGMDPATRQHGRPQHWGLLGMRERARQLKGRLVIESRPGVGTHVSLSLPAAVAYRR